MGSCLKEKTSSCPTPSMLFCLLENSWKDTIGWVSRELGDPIGWVNRGLGDLILNHLEKKANSQ